MAAISTGISGGRTWTTRWITRIVPTRPWHERLGVWQLALVGLALTLGQVALGCLLAGKSNAYEAYLTLLKFDSGFYLNVLVQGYHTSAIVPENAVGNVAFMPGYPLTARAVGAVLGLRGEYALLLTAQCACWGFWTYVLLFFRRWRVPAGLAATGVAAILCHPATVFLIAAYSEPLYLMTLVGFLYWMERPGPGALALAAGHGFLMTATRLVGAPLALYPLYCAWVGSERPASAGVVRRICRAILPSASAGLGVGLYLGYCAWQFEQWDIAARAHEVGWGVKPRLGALFSPKLFYIGWPSLKEGFIDPNFLSRLSVPVLLALFAGLFWFEWRQRTTSGAGFRYRLGLYGCGGVMLCVPIMGHSSIGLYSMIRFALCVNVMLVLAAVHLLRDAWPLEGSVKRRAVVLGGLWFLLSFSFQVAMTYRFTHSQWVA